MPARVPRWTAVCYSTLDGWHVAGGAGNAALAVRPGFPLIGSIKGAYQRIAVRRSGLVAHDTHFTGEQAAVLTHCVGRPRIRVRSQNHAIADVAYGAGDCLLVQWGVKARVALKQRLPRRTVAHIECNTLHLVLEGRMTVQTEPFRFRRLFHLLLKLQIAQGIG